MKTSECNISGYPSIDKPWLKYYGENIKTLHLDKCTIYDLIHSRNHDHLKETAIMYFGRKINFQRMFEEVEICTKALSAVGVKSGTCINLLTAGTPEAVYLVMACSRIGAISNFINPLLEETEKIDRINDTDSQWLFILDAMFPYIENVINKTCAKNIVVIPTGESFPSYLKALSQLKGKKGITINTSVNTIYWKSFLEKGNNNPLVLDIYSENKPVLMVYSSGTTGKAKGILHTNDSVNATIQDSLSSGLYLERGMTYLQMVPIWFSTGIIQSILLPLFCGVVVILEPRFDNKIFVKDMIKLKPNITLAATSMWMAAIDDAEFDKVDLSNLIYPFTGGEKITPTLEEIFNNFFVKHECNYRLVKGYGMCELGGKVTDSIAANKEGSVGIPMSHIVVGIFDPITNKELSYGDHGEIRVDTPAHMKEYYHNNTATSEFFWKDEKGSTWGCTGDIGYLDEDGLLFVLGRATDSFIDDNGKIVYLFDIEEEILKDNAINECKVVYTEVNNTSTLVAHVVFEKSISDEACVYIRIHKTLCDKLSANMVPRYFKAHQAMPINKNGKRDVVLLKNDINGLVTV